MDTDGDVMLPVPGEYLTEIAVGKTLPDYDSLLVCTHFKGHANDEASVDLVSAQPDDQRDDIVERIESRTGLHQLECIKTLEMGNNQYELITL